MQSGLMRQVGLRDTFFHLDRAIAFLEGREAEAFTPRERNEPRFGYAARDEVFAPHLPKGELRSLQAVVHAALQNWYREDEYPPVREEELVSTIRLLKRLLLAGETWP